MRLWRLAAGVLLSLFVVVPSWARPLPDNAGWAQEKSDLPPDPSVVYGSLPNGLRYALMRNDTPKDRISLRLVVNAGSLMETEEQRGLAHFLEHMAFKGSENLPAGDLVQYLERLGMAFGADTNARTSFENTVYQLELPANDAELIGNGLKVMRETADKLTIAAAEVDKERGVILSEKRLRDSPEYRSFTTDLEFLLPDSLISKRAPIGTDAVITVTPRDRLAAFYRKWYRPDRMIVVAVGNFDPAQFAKQIEQQFGSMKSREPDPAQPELGDIAQRGPPALLYSDPDAQTRISLQSVAYTDTTIETKASRVKELELYLANAMISRRLASLAMQGNAGFINGSAQASDLLRFARIGSISVQSKPDEWKTALSKAEQALRRALEHGFTQAELNEQKKNLVSAYEQQVKAASTRESRELANDLVEHLTAFSVYTAPQFDLTELNRTLPAITPALAQAALRELWGSRAPRVFVSGPIKAQQPEQEIVQALETSRAQAVTPPAEGQDEKFAYTGFGTATAIADKKVSSVMEVTQIRFANNVRLNLKRTPFDANTILVGLRFGGGRLELPTDKPGMKVLADHAFVAGGLQKHSLDELNRIIAGHNIGLEFSVEDEAFVFNGRTTPQDLLLQLQVMTAYLTAPGYRPEALEQLHQSLGPTYLNLTHTPGGVMQSQVSQFLRSGDPRFGVPPREQVEQRTLEELKTWLNGPLTRGYLEISIVGDFDLDAAQQAVASTFGSLPTREAAKPAYTEQREVHFPKQRELTTFKFDSRDPKAYATVYWPTTDFSHITEVRRLFVLSKVLEGRILDSIRGKQGLSYSVQGAHSPSIAFPDFGILYALVDSAPDKAETLALQMKEIGAGLATGNITQDELDRARNPLVNELKKLLRENSYLLNAIVSSSQEQPERLQRATTSVAELERMTVADINGTAARYLKSTDALPVLVVPAQGSEKTAQPEAVVPNEPTKQ
ncbi:MAG: insulinase family protein [Betaproteobacteria bacterium]